ncbi:MAG: hypothetical protein ABWZ89_13425, partial [Acidimicrobiales bacterium]
MSASGPGRRSVDVRTRSRGDAGPVDSAAFWADEWAAALDRNRDQAAADAELLGLDPLTVQVDGASHTLRLGAGGIEAIPGAETGLVVTLDGAAFSDLVHEERTALGLVIGGRVAGEGPAQELFCAWDPVLRSVLDGRGLYRPGAVALQASDGTDLDLDQRFRLDERDGAARFLTEAGFLLLQGVFTEAEMAVLDSDLAAAVGAARPDDGASWWAATSDGERYPCRILDLADRSEQLHSLLGDPRFLAIGRILDDGHEPGDPFGEHFSEVTAEGLVKRVGSVE